MSKQGTPVRYDFYRQPTTPRLAPIFVESYNATDTTELFKMAAKVFLFDRTELLKFFNTHEFKKFRMVSKKGGMIVKIFADSSPKQRIECEHLRVNGMYEKDMTPDRTALKEQYKVWLDEMLAVANKMVK